AHFGVVLAVHAALRTDVAVADRSATSRVLVTGTDALDVLKGTFAGHMEDIEEGRSMRVVRLDGQGLIRDLALVTRTGGIAYLVIGEAGQRFETVAALKRAVQADFDARVEDRTESTCLIALAGPGAAAFIREQLADALPARLETLHSVTFEFHGFRALAIRASNTGEDGFELMTAPAVAQHLLETVREAGKLLIGSEAWQTARVESCIPAFEPDIRGDLSPGEADLDGLLDIEPGRARWLLSALLFDGNELPAPGTPVTLDGSHAGEVRSAVRSPLLGAGAGLAIVQTALALPGTRLDAGGAGATITSKPFYRRRG
ncbi:MAG: glycine cleavage T C-terminal barrel domain-containing protein, partial [Dehalococcoidia bacterium]